MEGLVNYSDSDNSENSENSDLNNNNELIKSESCDNKVFDAEEIIVTNKRKLPSVSDLFGSKSPKLDIDDFGKKRTIPHRRGNWATHIYLEITITTTTSQKIRSLINTLAELKLTKLNSIVKFCENKQKLKISLSKTWYLAWSFHEKFLFELEAKVKSLKKFIINYPTWQLFSNEDKSRHFISLNIGKGHNKIEEMGLKIDQLGEIFNLEEFYKPPKYHSSIAWFLPINNLSEFKLNEKLGNCREFEDGESYLVSSVWCQIGNKKHEFKLS